MSRSARDPYLRGIALSAGGMVVLSPDGLLIRLVAEAGAWDIIFYRGLFTGISLTLFFALRFRARFFRMWRGLDPYTALSSLFLAGGSLAFVGAITHTSVANTLVILATMPLFSALLGWLLIGERVRPRTWIAIVLALGGIAVIFAGSLGGGTLAGDLMALAGAVLHGLNLVLLRRAGDRDASPAVCLAGFVAAAVALPFAEPLAVTARDLGVLALLGLVVQPLALALFVSGTRYVPAAEIALLALLETVLGPLWAWLGVGEVPPQEALVGGAVIVAAIALNAALAVRSNRRAARASLPIE